MAETAITARDIRDLLAKRYPSDKWALKFEVRDQTGFQAARNSFADAIAMHRWPSHAHVIHGFEIKTTRGDWQRELAKPDKAERIMAHCDHFWLVAPAGVHLDSELPPLWGCIRATPKALRVVKDAPRLTEANFEGKRARPLLPSAMARGFVASLLRSAQAGDAEFQEALDRATDDIRKRLASQRDYELDAARKERDNLRDWISRFEEAFGTPFNPIWGDPAVHAGRVKAAMRLAALAADTDRLNSIEHTGRALLDALAALRGSLEDERNTR